MTVNVIFRVKATNGDFEQVKMLSKSNSSIKIESKSSSECWLTSQDKLNHLKAHDVLKSHLLFTDALLRMIGEYCTELVILSHSVENGTAVVLFEKLRYVQINEEISGGGRIRMFFNEVCQVVLKEDVVVSDQKTPREDMIVERKRIFQPFEHCILVQQMLIGKTGDHISMFRLSGYDWWDEEECPITQDKQHAWFTSFQLPVARYQHYIVKYDDSDEDLAVFIDTQCPVDKKQSCITSQGPDWIIFNIWMLPIPISNDYPYSSINLSFDRKFMRIGLYKKNGGDQKQSTTYFYIKFRTESTSFGLIPKKINKNQ